MVTVELNNMADFFKKGVGYFTSAWSNAPASESEKIIVREVLTKNGSLFVRVAGLSGLLAVGLGAYGAHGMQSFHLFHNLCVNPCIF